MRSKLRNRFRIGALCLIALLILIPLMSSPVAAPGTFTYPCSATTDNTPTGPTAIALCPPPYSFNNPGPNSATFTCSYSFTDSHPTGTGSNHKATLTITPPGAPTGQITTGWVFIAANAGTTVGTLTVGPLGYTPPASWTVFVEVWCQDIQTQQTIYNSQSVTVSA